MAACLTSTSCVAFDFGPLGCVLHNNADDLTTAYYAPGVTHFVRNRHCPPTSPLSTESVQTTTTSDGSTTGMSYEQFCYLTVHEIVRFVSAGFTFLPEKNI